MKPYEEKAAILKRTKGLPRIIRDKLDKTLFTAEKEEDDLFFSYNKMGATRDMRVTIGVATMKTITCLNKKRTSVRGGNHSRPIA